MGESRAEIARGINRVTGSSTQRQPNGENEQTDRQRAECPQAYTSDLGKRAD